MKQLTPQQQEIVTLLRDGRWHCMAGELFMKDDRKRISELNRMGYVIEGEPCDGTCGKRHSSRVYMRRMGTARQERVMYIRHPLTGEIMTTREYAAL